MASFSLKDTIDRRGGMQVDLDSIAVTLKLTTAIDKHVRNSGDNQNLSKGADNDDLQYNNSYNN